MWHAHEVVIRVALPGVASKSSIQLEPAINGCHLRVPGRYLLSVRLRYKVMRLRLCTSTSPCSGPIHTSCMALHAQHRGAQGALTGGPLPCKQVDYFAGRAVFDIGTQQLEIVMPIVAES